MSNSRHFPVGLSVSLAVLGGIFYSAAGSGESAASINPASIPRIGTVEERFQSYNVEMLEVTGGRFWKPYKELKAISQHAGGCPAIRVERRPA